MNTFELDKRMIRFMTENKIKGLKIIYTNLCNLLTVSEDINILLEYMKYNNEYPNKYNLIQINKNISNIIDILYEEKINSNFDGLKIDFEEFYKIKNILDIFANLFDTQLDRNNLQNLINYSYKSEDEINHFRNNNIIENKFINECNIDIYNYKLLINKCIQMVIDRKRELDS
jgi:hypothetical protein